MPLSAVFDIIITQSQSSEPQPPSGTILAALVHVSRKTNHKREEENINNHKNTKSPETNHKKEKVNHNPNSPETNHEQEEKTKHHEDLNSPETYHRKEKMNANNNQTDPEASKIIPIVHSMGTGSRCVGNVPGGLYSHILRDSHAEVLARRALLHVALKRKEEKRDGLPSTGWVLYVSHPPCGDACVPEIREETGREFEDDVQIDGGSVKKRKIKIVSGESAEKETSEEWDNIPVESVHPEKLRSGATCPPGGTLRKRPTTGGPCPPQPDDCSPWRSLRFPPRTGPYETRSWASQPQHVVLG